MCWSCFKLYADAPVVNERVLAAYRQIKDTDASSSPLLHIYVGDMNLDDHFFESPSRYALGVYDEAEQWERDIFDALKELSEAERATAVAMEWGYIEVDGTLREDLRGGASDG